MYEHITILKEKNQVIKETTPEVAFLESTLSKAAYALSQEVSNFKTPSILESDLAKGTIVYEYCHRIRPLFAFRSDHGLFLQLVTRAAHALFSIHCSLKAETRVPIEFPNISDGLDDHKAFLHGDFNLENVQYDQENDQIIIIDWSLTPLFKKGRGNYGAIHWDVCWFIRSIFFTPPHFGLDYSRRREASMRFLTTYFDLKGDQKFQPGLRTFLSLCYNFSTRDFNTQMAFHQYLRQSVCRRNFRRYSTEVEKYIHR
jgi:hypothetical protein